MTIPPYTISKDNLLEELKTTKDGLSSAEAEKRLKENGPNTLTQKKKVSPLSIYLSQFKNTLTIILLGSVVLVLFVYFFGEQEQSDLIEAGLILAIVFMITTLGFIQEFKAEKALESLKKLLAFKVKVLREKKEQEIDVINLVTGDIVIIEEGLKVPADIRLLEVFNLYANEASLTGESTTVEKEVKELPEPTQLADQKNMIFAGTAITSGRAIGVVVRTGDQTEIGNIAGLVASSVDEATPIQKKLDNIGKALGYIVMGVCVIVFFFIFFFAKEFADQEFMQKLLHSFIAAVALAIAAIPEGLPAVVTISLALGTQRMAKKNALVRKLNAVETLGSVDIICSDKTGTLTKNEMTVKEIFSNDKLFSVSGIGYSTEGEFTVEGKKADIKELSLLLQAGKYCNNAAFDGEKVLGDPTEAALLISAAKAGRVDSQGGSERVFEIPFSSERKFMSVVVKIQDKYFLFAKGAPEVVLSHSTEYLQGDKTDAVTQEAKGKINREVEAMNKRALRTLGFAYKELNKAMFVDDAGKPHPDPLLKGEAKKLEENMIFLGLQGMIDPAREEVRPLIEQCRTSGIRVIMITGDHQTTAAAVAAEIGITGEAISGEELEKISDEDFVKRVEQISIYARVNPSSKMKIISALKKNGHIVAMTGDGVNDAPALKKADIGISMGITGTDVAKEASDIVLLDDKFSTIVAAIEEGRGIFQNIRKFVQYLLSCNIGEVLLIFAGVLIYQDLLLTATMLLWINVVTDGLPAVALGMDKVGKEILSLSPKKFQVEIITKKMWIEMVVFGLLLTVALLGLYQYNITREHEIEAMGAVFIAIAFFELVYLFIIRSAFGTPVFSNKWLHLSILVTILLQIAIVYVPFLANLFGVHHIDLVDWLYIAISSAVIWILFTLFKKALVI